MLYVNQNLPCKSLTTEIDNLTESIFLEVNVQVPNGYLWVVTNRQVKTKNFLFISNQSKTINAFSTKYNNILLMGDFNLTTIENKHFEELLNLFNSFRMFSVQKSYVH